MLKLSSHIVIEGQDGRTWEFHSLSSCTIVDDTEALTTTCTIALPKKITWQGAVDGSTRPPVKRGDKIKVRLGYDGDYKTRFIGYIREVSTGTPVKLECEDGMFDLKKKGVAKKGYKIVTLGKLITDLLVESDVKSVVIEENVVLGQYRITRNSVAEELAELKTEFGLSAYFRIVNEEPQLYVGFTYPLENRATQRFLFGKNIISEDLEYRNSEDIRLKVKATSVLANNKRITVEVGDKDGELRTVYRYNVNESELKKFATTELNRFKYTGYRGSFIGFGEPMVSKVDIADLTGSDGRRGKYLIKKVETTFGTGGYRQQIEVGQLLT